jgi:hypothetical protein
MGPIYVYVLYIVLTINSDYFSKHFNRLAFGNQRRSGFCDTGREFLYDYTTSTIEV